MQDVTLKLKLKDVVPSRPCNKPAIDLDRSTASQEEMVISNVAATVVLPYLTVCWGS